MELRVLGVDPGLTTGYSTREQTGHWDFTRERKASMGDCLHAFRKHLLLLIAGQNITMLAIEQPIPQNRTSAQLQFGMFGVALELATELDIAYRAYNPASIKRFAIKNIAASGAENNSEPPDNIPASKLACWQYARMATGRDDLTTDECDAIVLRALCEEEHGQAQD